MILKKFKPVLFFAVALIAIFLSLQYAPYLTLESLKASQAGLSQYREAHPGLAELSFFLIYVLSTALSIPGAGILTLAGGALFGVVWGTVLVSLASTLGATLSFLLVRYFVGDWARSKFRGSFQKIDHGFNEEGSMYLLSLRLIPLFPFFAVNAMMGLTKISAKQFFLISQIGMFPGTVVYVWAGEELGSLQSLSDLASPSLLLAFTALGLVPWFAKALLQKWKTQKLYSKFKKPKKYDYNLVVIGAGAAGLVSTAIARAVKAKVAIIEKHKMGGDCLNYGCVPSKALIHLANHSPRAPYLEIQQKIQKIIQRIEPHDSVERFTKLGARVIQGSAELVSPWEVQVNGEILTTKNVIIASGAEPYIPEIPGREKIKSVTSETLWDLEKLPARLLVLGGGPVGCELAQAFSKLGVKVTLIEKGLRLLAGEVEEASRRVCESLQRDGVEILLQSEIQTFLSEKSARVVGPQGAKDLEFDQVLFAVGRKPRTRGFGLEKIEIHLDQRGRVARNGFMQTNFPNIFVCGDVTSEVQLTHVAGHQAWYAAMNALFGRFKLFKEDLRVIPRCTFTSPQVASVGLSPEKAKEIYGEVEVTKFPMDDFDRAICDEATQGFIQIVTPQKGDQILGVTIVAAQAGELIAEYALAMRWSLGLKKILGTVHAYPTWSDANKLAALEWQRKKVPHQLLKFVEKYHDWQRK
ncbi:MAG: FAD-dependent oxidoreductase [Pseudobdellovibrionaceae bacterium]